MGKPDIDAFRALGDAGLTLIPLDGKKPRDKNWTKRAYAIGAVLGGCNAGVRLENFHLVLDVDPRNGGDESLRRLSEALGVDLDQWTPITRTGSGGRHLWMRVDPGAKLAGKLKGYPGIDIRKIGNQVVAPGSIHPETGKPYVLEDPFDELTDLPLAPPGLSALLDRGNTKADATEKPDGAEDEPVLSAGQIAKLLPMVEIPGGQGLYEDWLAFVMGCHAASGGDPAVMAALDEWCEIDANLEARWEGFGERADGVGFGTVARLAQEYAVEGKAAEVEAWVREGRAVADFSDADDTAEVVMTDEEKAAMQTEVAARPKWAPQTSKTTGAMVNNITNALGAVKLSGLRVAFDEFRQTATFSNVQLPWDPQHGRLLNDVTARQARMHLLRKFHRGPNGEPWNYQPSNENVWDALLMLAERNVTNPLTEWLSGLTWDGTTRVEQLFPRYFKTADDDYTRAVSVCFMIGAIKRAFEPGCKFDTMPVLKGKQGKSKSTGIKALFGADWFSDADLNLRDKDAAVMLQGKWVHEFAELQGMTRAEVSAMKAFFSRGEDRLRPAYGRSVIALPRRCVFIGTVNEGGYLRDQTGNRRYWPLEVGGEDGEAMVDVEAIKADREQLWAEAVAMYRSGVSADLAPHLWELAGERQRAETSEDPWAEDIRRFLELRAQDYADYEADTGDFAPECYRAGETPPVPYRVHTIELLDHLGLKGHNRNSAVTGRLGTVMTSCLGWKPRDIRITGNQPEKGRGFFDPKNDPSLS